MEKSFNLKSLQMGFVPVVWFLVIRSTVISWISLKTPFVCICVFVCVSVSLLHIVIKTRVKSHVLCVSGMNN